MQRVLASIAILWVTAALPLPASEADATAISKNIQAVHMPFGTVLDPMFVSTDSDQIAGYTRCGDSALWAGHYLAAESFRYAVTKSPEALGNAERALDGIRSLVDVTGTDLLARCLVPESSPYAAGIASEEAHNGVYKGKLGGKTYLWIGNTSRDQYSGVMFGLSVAYTEIPDAAVRGEVRSLVTRVLRFLGKNDWKAVMPDGRVSTTFFGRFDQQLAFLAVGRQVDPQRFGGDYEWSRMLYNQLVIAPVALDTLDTHSSYFKFNLDAINLYTLRRLDAGAGQHGYDVFRHATKSHGNAFFDVIDRGLNGPDAARDAEIRALLAAWLRRPRRDFSVDLRGVLATCGSGQACAPIPVERRVNTDFLWQRSPFQLVGGGEGLIETAGIDYILPYWMARFYGVL